jgi:S1-C subfamily serine protease
MEDFNFSSANSPQTPVQPQAQPQIQSQLPLPGSTPPAPPTPTPTGLKPLNAMLGGGVLACALVGLGIMLGSRSAPSLSGFGGRGEQERIVNAVAKVAPAVMNIDTELAPDKGDSNFLPMPGSDGPPQGGKGTGVIFDRAKRLMLTNAHVVSDPNTGAAAKKISVTTRDGQKFAAKLLGRDRRTDIAVVQLEKEPPAEAKLAAMKNANDVQIGQWAIAIGNPFAQANTVTLGVISATGRTIPVPSSNRIGGQGQVELKEMIQTDAAINPGNSGGPLCNINGEVIGINTVIYGIGTGLGFSIPINKAKAIAEEIVAKGRVEYAFLGVGVETITDGLKTEFGLPDKVGVMVKSLYPNTSAAKAGIVEGDVLRSFDGTPLKNADDFQKRMNAKKVGDEVKIELFHEGAKKTVTLKIGAKPDDVE